ncbi:hypothetical protein [Hahella sp. NBU794]|uniref:hypothetical protein n=1 Tax=Hahella sp. NBU794 TaxID=3422590 RepID=UPI003D6E1B7A
MRLDFNVLWIDDQQRHVESQREKIENIMRLEGFRLRTEFASNMNEAKNFIENDIYRDHIDLVLMDYNLGAGTNGADGIVEVRRHIEFKDIIFYSSQAPDLKEKVAERKVEGIFCSTREDLPHTVAGVFEALIKKVIDIDHSRGIVMGATSSIDQLVNECLSTLFDSSEKEEKGKTIALITTKLEEKKDKFLKDLDALSKIEHLRDLSKHHGVYTSNDRLILLRKILETHSDFSHIVELINKYSNNTVPNRNLLAHVTVTENGFSRKLFNRQGKELTVNDMRTLRQELLGFHSAIEDVFNKLKPTESE